MLRRLARKVSTFAAVATLSLGAVVPAAAADLNGEFDKNQAILNSDEFRAYEQAQKVYDQQVVTSPQVANGDVDSVDPASSLGTFSTNPNPTYDDRIGALYFLTKFGSTYATRSCTAEYLGGKFWLTARHCIVKPLGRDAYDHSNLLGFILQSDHQYAGIQNIYMHPDEGVDLALVKVGTGISAQPFTLSSSLPAEQSVLTAIGYSGHGTTTHNFSSLTRMRVIDNDATVPVDGYRVDWRNVSEMEQVDSYRTCKGDSGGPAYRHNTLYSVISATDTKANTNGYDKCFDLAYFTNVSPFIDWITNTMNNNSGSTYIERFNSFMGGVAAANGGKSAGVHDGDSGGNIGSLATLRGKE